MNKAFNFNDAFKSLTGFEPMKWQCRLFHRFIEDGEENKPGIPTVCDIPTGLGKTSIIVIWLIALAHQAATLGTVRLPRRLVYIVNRRTVVDQATQTVEVLRQRLLEPDAPAWGIHAQMLKKIGAALRGLCYSEQIPIAVSTLRGELADNGEWKADPARPAIVVGTVDMIGSKLLFSGYGDGRYDRPHHAGLIGYDVLIVHDEAHLAPAFNQLLRAVEREQRCETSYDHYSRSIARPVRVVELSATTRGTDGGLFTLEWEDEQDAVVQKRMTAAKRLELHDVKGGSVVEEIVRCAQEHEKSSSKVLIYVRTPEQAQEVASKLAESLCGDSKERIGLLTGTMRGYERDELVEKNPVYRALLAPEVHVEKTVYLVSTSAGEVGIDLDADHLVCDVTTLDALIQRLGRVNRRGGERREAKVDVVVPSETKQKPTELDSAMAATYKLLKRWVENTGNHCVEVDPKNLRRLLHEASSEEVKAAFSPQPPTPLLTDILLDNWSLTSMEEMPRHMDIAPFLHGLTDDPPETYVAWRLEVSVLAKHDADEASLRHWFRACPIETRERLRDRTDRVKKVLQDLLGGLRKDKGDSSLDFRIVLLDERGGASWSRLSDLTAKNANLAYRTVVLPPEVGGLDANGMLEARPGATPPKRLDVAEDGSIEGRRERWLHLRLADGDRFQRLASGEVAEALPPELQEKVRIPLCHTEEWDDEGESLDLVLLISSTRSAVDNPEATRARQTLEVHTNAIVKHMERIVERLGIEEPTRSVLLAAARWHDKGKDRAVWQRYAGNREGAAPLAKAPRYQHPRELGGYRHEFGSLMDAMKDEDLRQLCDHDLVFHLIAAHHGWARPHFEPRCFDSASTTGENREALREVVRIFGRLQQRYGRWGLAWLESLLRCADITTSREAVAVVGPPAGAIDLVQEEGRS